MPTYDTTSPKYIQAKQERLEELGRYLMNLENLLIMLARAHLLY